MGPHRLGQKGVRDRTGASDTRGADEAAAVKRGLRGHDVDLRNSKAMGSEHLQTRDGSSSRVRCLRCVSWTT